VLEKFHPQILLRFDDLHCSMNWAMWDKIECLLDDYCIKPIVAVIPKNQDNTLVYGDINDEAGFRFKAMNMKGYEVSLHGFNHVYNSENAGIFGLSERSEFAGVDTKIQRRKIKEGLKIFKDFGVIPRCWVGPNHSYDYATIQILDEYNFQIVSDGFHRVPYMLTKNMILIPQQKWKMKATLPGVVTVCYHHNNWNENMFKKFKDDLSENYNRIVNVDHVIGRYFNRRKQFSDVFTEKVSREFWSAKEYLRKLITK